MKVLKDKNLIILGILAVLFFLIYCYFPLTSAPLRLARLGSSARLASSEASSQSRLVFNMPDENVNYFFAKLFAQTSQLKYFEPLNELALNRIHPRSFNVIQGSLVPQTFLGLILLYGFLAKIFGVCSITFFTPILAILGVFFFYGFLKNIFDNRIAFLSSILFLFNPAWWFYTSRSMNHTVLFLVFILGALYFLTRIKKLKINYLLSGLFLGGALTVRLPEIVLICWLGFLLALITKKINWQALALIILGVVLIFIPILYYQNQTFGHPLSTGYTRFDSRSTQNELFTSPVAESFGPPLSYFFPFGLNLKNIVTNFYHYQLELFWFFAVLAFFGFCVFWLKKLPYRKYFWYFGFLFFWLNLFYGSWLFYDNPDITQYGIGNSYVRYFLPIYIFGLPLVSLFILFLSQKIKEKYGQLSGQLSILVLVFFLFFMSARIVLVQTPESLLPLEQSIVEYNQRADKIFGLTPPHSVFLTKRAEKFLFPERKVIYLREDDTRLEEVTLKLLENEVPVYHYLLNGEEEFDFFDWGVDLGKVEEIREGEVLYRVELKI